MVERLKSRISPLALILAASAIHAPARAADTTITGTDPLATSSVGGLAAGDTLTLDDSTDIELTASGQAAITVDTDISVIQEGSLHAAGIDNVTGVLIGQNVSGDIRNAGSISLTDGYSLSDIDGDGDLDADTDGDGIADFTQGVTHTGFAIGTGRIGMWVLDGVTLAGSLNNGFDSADDDLDQSGAITVEGDASFGIRIDGVVDGDVLSPGTISVTGDNSFGVRIGDGGGGVSVTGDVTVGDVSVRGENSVGVAIIDGVSGALTLRGTVSVSGYHSTARPSDVSDTDGADGVDYYELEAEDKLQSGAAIDVRANVDGGILLVGIGLEDDEDDDRDGVPVGDDLDDNRTSAITVYGRAPAVQITGGALIGPLNYDFAANPVGLDNGQQFGLYNRGTISAFGIFNDVAATGIGIDNATIAGGLLNDGAVSATAYNADAFAIWFSNGATGQLVNRNTLSATVYSNSTPPADVVSDDVAADDTAYAIHIGAGSSLASITNTGAISVIGYDSDADSTNEAHATAIYDASNSLSSITNSGSISAQVFTRTTDTNVTPVAGGRAIAIDLSSNSLGVTLTQAVNVINEDDGPDADGDATDPQDAVQTPSIVGDILLGSGADAVILNAGTVTGFLSFGAGADTFTLNGGGFRGRLEDSDAALDLFILDGALRLVSTPGLDGAMGISNATFGPGAVVTFELTTDNTSASLLASQTVTVQDGAQFRLVAPVGLIESGSRTIVSAATLTLDNEAALFESVRAAETNSYLYNFSLARAPGNANALEASYQIKTAAELELDRNRTAIFSPLIAALRTDSDASAAFASLTTRTYFLDAYDDLMPNFSSAAVELAATAIGQGQAAMANRLSMRRAQAPGEATIWAQEIGYAVDRTAPTGAGADFSGHGFGLAFGIDGPLQSGQTLGLSAAFISSESTEDGSGADGTLAAWFVQGGAYLSADLGSFALDLAGGAGFGRMKSRREIAFGGFAATTNAEWSAYEEHALARLALPLDAGWLSFTPQTMASFVALQEDGYAEAGGGGAIDIAVEASTSQRLWIDSGVSVNLRRDQGEGLKLSPNLFLGYRLNALDDPAERTMRFVSGGAAFALEDDPIGDGGPLVSFGLDIQDHFTAISLSYEGAFSDEIERHSLNAALRVRF